MLGGKWGKQSRPGNTIKGIYTIDEAKEILEKLYYYIENGVKLANVLEI